MSELPVETERLDFDQAAQLVLDEGGAAFAAIPVFGDDGEAAEGARIFILDADGGGALRIRFIAGPFFSAAIAGHEVLAAHDIPEQVRSLRFLATSWRDEWLSDQMQVLIAKLMHAAKVVAPQMPNYLSMPVPAAVPDVVFPVSLIGRAPKR
ncbi:MAG TPA: hypothetical protein VMU33_07580 [Burkholderiaceae bacterium]|nr:hypothetical protein [Burkholderiaceae bacterium]